MSELFRREVLDAKWDTWTSEVGVAQPARAWILGAVVCCVLLAALLFAWTFSYASRVAVPGKVVPSAGVASLVAPVSGTIARIDGFEGEIVQKGQSLVWIDGQRLTLSGYDATNAASAGYIARKLGLVAISKSQIERIEADIAAAVVRQRAGADELAALESEARAISERIEIARGLLHRYESLRAQDYVSDVQISQQKVALIAAQSDMRALERSVNQIRSSVSEEARKIESLSAQREGVRASTENDLHSLEQDMARQDASGGALLKAPRSGVIASRLVEPGQNVQSGQLVASIVPDGSRMLTELQAPSRAIGAVQVGQRVRIRFHAFPYQKFGQKVGRIIRISRDTISTPSGEAVFRVIVELESEYFVVSGRRERILPGMTVEADMFGERRSVIEWMMDPLKSAASGVSS